MSAKQNELNFKGGNPGAVQYGNFINYYQFHPPENRLKLLPTDIWSKISNFQGLDLGCNSGDLTLEMYSFIRDKVEKTEILGVDIDSNLIERANEKSQNNDVIFYSLDIMDNTGKETIYNYMKTKNLNKFDCVFCFSLTMWIHLNHGDEGLKQFLKYIVNLGNLIVIEPQPWKCYKTAVKRMKQNCFQFPYFPKLKIRQTIEDEIEAFLTNDCGATKIFESERTDWGRKLLIFKHPADT